MHSLTVELKERQYPIVISDDINDFTSYIQSACPGTRVVIVTDSTVSELYLDAWMQMFSRLGYSVLHYVFPEGEQSKNLKTVEAIYGFLCSHKVQRHDVMIALGGGVVGDVTGFVASTYLRGIGFIQCPTTLLAQVDSSVGGKVGINYQNIKNNIGSFYQPDLVIINPGFIRTLPRRYINAGIVEILVHCIIADNKLFEYVSAHIEDIYSFDNDVLEYLIHENCTIKSEIVCSDEFDRGIRAVLNFGHTIGHAVESVSGFSLSHGEAVSIGIAGAFRLGEALGLTQQGEKEKVVALLVSIGLPVTLDGFDIDQVFEKILLDKKSRGNEIEFIIPIAVGHVERTSISDNGLIYSVLKELYTH
ncbi:3-dehydroquinate synthase [Paenibacillus tepidiphilus]|uniref:3-dehydroquinate synthase n=1 Tax=Paenibacillus tepidiphilus TaxID=2608683 RepID=UPI00123C049B|nr:3-dehydroquinate synthase [Paenibacillus tepidiphilus]